MSKTILTAMALALASCGASDTGEPSSGPPPEPSPPPPEATAPADAHDAVAHVAIDGMVCEGCANAARACLEGVDGVHYVDVRLEDAEATVRYDPERLDPTALVTALEAVDRGEAPPFEARLLPP